MAIANDTVYFRVTDIWKRLCEEHYTLFNLTCDEYVCLLDSDIENLEAKVAEKEEVIKTIGRLENLRQEVIKELNAALPQGQSLDSVRALLALMIAHPAEAQGRHLDKFNALLIDLIEKIQQQNKRNQAFINKALRSLKDIREEVTGEKSYATYTAKGSAQTTSARKD
jgi:flagellar biosynthesis/type III secretory pathway chaperone